MIDLIVIFINLIIILKLKRMSGKSPFPTKSLLIAVIADESTVTGFLLTGIGQRGKNGEQNYMICNKDTTD